MYKIATTAGDATTPSGLAQVNNFVDASFVNNTTKMVYGGDTLGNIWRFDVNDTFAPSGREAALIGVAKDPSNNPQPITIRPELAELNNKPIIFVGTGKLLGNSDFIDTQVQSVYGIVDTLVGSPVYPNLRSVLAPLKMTQSGAIRTVACTGTTIQCGSTSGWIVDLPESRERVNVEMKLARGTLAFGSNVPQDDACKVGGHSWLNFLNFSNGLAVTSSPSFAVSVLSTDALIVGLNIVDIQSRMIGLRRFSDGTGDSSEIPFTMPPPTGKRISWREIVQ
jgi:type IV pilus assembly protein PilY1